MKINFVFPHVPRFISGGLKMVLEYANRLTERGHEVRIIFDCEQGMYEHRKYIPLWFKHIVYPLMIAYYPRWFQLNPKVKKICAKTGINDKEIPDGDVVIATAVATAEPVSRLSPVKGKKLYFIQDFENWDAGWTDERVKATYHLGLTNIVIAKWLKNIVEGSGAPCVLIPNGIDFKIFNIDIPIKERDEHTISMLYHIAPHKGAKYGIQALLQLKKKYPDLKAHLFGVPARPDNLSEWMDYTQNATQKQLRDIYNHSTIYLCPSIAEGFGLTGAEAMACGAAYVASDYGGIHEYAEDKRNVLLSQPKDVDALVEHVSYLFENDDERQKLAENGYKDIQKFNWGSALDKFEETMREQKII